MDDEFYDVAAFERDERSKQLLDDYRKSLEGKIDKALQAVLIKKDKRTLKDWAHGVLVDQQGVEEKKAWRIVNDEIQSWKDALIDFDWQRPIKKCSLPMREIAAFSVLKRLEEVTKKK